MNYKEKTHRVFNKFFSSFLKDLKEVDEDLRKLVKVSYKAINKTSSEYCEYVVTNMIPHLDKLKSSSFEDESVKGADLAKGISLGFILEKVSGDDKKEDRTIVLNYVYILVLFAYMSTLDDENELFTQVVRVLGFVQAKNIEEYDGEKDDIIDDDIKDLLEKVREYEITPKVEVKTEFPSTRDIFGSLENSKIADLAKEIAKDVDFTALKGEDPEDMIKNMFDCGSGNNMLGNIISKVSSTLNNKINSGELKHDDLLGEAMSMMNIFNDGNNPLASNPLFANMMKAMKSGKATMRQDVMKKSDTRERLRKKLEMKKKNVE